MPGILVILVLCIFVDPVSASPRVIYRSIATGQIRINPIGDIVAATPTPVSTPPSSVPSVPLDRTRLQIIRDYFGFQSLSYPDSE